VKWIVRRRAGLILGIELQTQSFATGDAERLLMEINLVTVAYTLVGVGFFPTGEVMGMMLLGHGQSSDICIDVIVFVLMY
jgi:hypothetical protein